MPLEQQTASFFAVAASILTGIHATHTFEPWAVLVAAAFTMCYFLALQLAPQLPHRGLQIAMVVTLIGLSFALHLLFLPGGICCAVAIMIVKTDLLLPPKPKEKDAAKTN